MTAKCAVIRAYLAIREHNFEYKKRSDEGEESVSGAEEEEFNKFSRLRLKRFNCY